MNLGLNGQSAEGKGQGVLNSEVEMRKWEVESRNAECGRGRSAWGMAQGHVYRVKG